MEPQSYTEPEEDQEKPPGKAVTKNPPRPRLHPRPQWLVAVIANIKGDTELPINAPPDAGAEYDRLETVQSIQAGIESAGHRTTFIPGDRRLPSVIQDVRPDICFNIAEGLRGDAREAQVPALLEMLGIPYTASRVMANAISLDKTITKRLWRDAGLPVVPFQEFSSPQENLRPGMHFPLFVKPAREGTGMGVDSGAVVHDKAELKNRIHWVLQTYRQPALVEWFLPGREFTVGVLGQSEVRSFSQRSYLYAEDGFHRFPILEIDSRVSITPGVYGYKAKSKDLTEAGAPGYHCPANIDSKLVNKLYRLALRAHQAIGALDVSRIDFRMDAAGNPYLLEINTLPGLNPNVSDLCVIAEAEGFPYQDMILEILDMAAARFGLLPY